ncbi:Uncharacterised protein [Klebsiella pneumoniae]|nr:Uncharacterised protein [Klebsiella pneumoniae]SLS05318.1 Uncharacterised protein [Klebsiella pneumoniae]SLT10766.1 Uncharacterised protein [Klebsiella pneumoniae]SLT17731.1 Uncharacterised protein [Klebsiella pneumoniae]SLU12529.1 Uncharacterised protein [Klebsiella pneumoniae]
MCQIAKGRNVKYFFTSGAHLADKSSTCNLHKLNP